MRNHNNFENYVPGPGRVPGVFIWAWSDYGPPELISRDYEAMDRLRAVACQGMMSKMSKLSPAIRYVDRFEYDSTEHWEDGGVFIPYEPELLAKVLALLAPYWLKVVLPACLNTDDNETNERIGKTGELYAKCNCAEVEDPGGSEAVVLWLDENFGGELDFRPEELADAKDLVDHLYTDAKRPNEKLIVELEKILPAYTETKEGSTV